jgi:XTP/dITP diphosphohydrolase
MTTYSREEQLKAFGRLLDIMDELREKCPWDRKQTFESLRILTIEETYELADAIIDQNPQHIKEEVGDIMLHMAFYSKLGSEIGAFDMADVLNVLCEKLIVRHPHIYSDVKVADEDEVSRNWEQIKLKEGKKSLLEGVPKSLPALVKAYRMQEKTKQVGFEWETPEQCWEKVVEELEELQVEVKDKNQEKMEGELGDLLFAIVNYARFINVDPETALEKTNRKFKRRFEYIEKNAPAPLPDMNLEALDELWNEAKRKGL